MSRSICIVSVFVLISCLASAAQAAERQKNWSDEAELSFVDTAGNTEVSTLSAKNTLVYRLAPDRRIIWKFAALYGETDGEKTAESYFTELRAEEDLSEQVGAYLLGGWLKDTFAGVDPRYYVGLGGIYKFLPGPVHLLVGEAGVTYTAEEYTDNTDKQFVGGRVFMKYELAFHEKAKFTQTVEWLPDLENTDDWLFNSETAVLAGLNSYLSLKTSYVLKYDNEPVSGLEETDTILSVALVVNY